MICGKAEIVAEPRVNQKYIDYVLFVFIKENVSRKGDDHYILRPEDTAATLRADVKFCR